MREVVIAGRRRDAKRLIAALQEAGVVHLRPIPAEGPVRSGVLDPEDAERKRRLERLLARVDSTLGELAPLPTASEEPPTPERWEDYVEEAAQAVQRVSAERSALRSDLEAATSYGKAAGVIAALSHGLDRSPRLAALAVVVDDAAALSALEAGLAKALPSRYLVAQAPLADRQLALILTMRADREAARGVLLQLRTGELRLPTSLEELGWSEAAKRFSELQANGFSRLQALESELRRLAKLYSGQLLSLQAALRDAVAIYDVQSQVGMGRYSLFLRGYLPANSEARLREVLRPMEDLIDLRLADPDLHAAKEIPVKLTNNRYARNFELLLAISAPPRYDTFDPTWIIAAFFPFFFGFVIADIGFGLLFLWLALSLRARSRSGKGLDLGFMGIDLGPGLLGQVAYILTTMSVWTLVFGCLTGEIFGSLGEHLRIFHLPGHPGLIPILFPRLQSNLITTAVLISIAFGIVQVLWAWGLRAQLSLKHGERQHFFEAAGMFGGLVGLILYAYGFLTHAATPLTNDVMLLGFLVFVIGLAATRAAMMVFELISNGGYIISYVRLFAVGLASAILAKLATDLGWGIYQQWGLIGAILGIVIAFIVQAAALTLTIIGHVLQPLRLHYVEFLSPTGFYDNTGPRYAPFRRLARTEHPEGL